MLAVLVNTLGSPCYEIEKLHEKLGCCDRDPVQTTDASFPIPNWWHPIETYFLSKGLKTENLQPETQCLVTKTAHDIDDCCTSFGVNSIPYCGKSVICTYDGVTPKVQEFDKEYIIHIQEPDGNYHFTTLGRVHTNNSSEKVMDLYAHYLYDCQDIQDYYGNRSWVVEGSACVNITIPGGSMHPDSVSEYSLDKQTPRARGYYNSSSSSYEFTWDQISTGLGKDYRLNTNHTPDLVRLQFNDDMSMKFETEPKGLMEWVPSFYQIASAENVFKGGGAKYDLFSEDGSLKSCNRFWAVDGWGLTYNSVVKIVNGTSELHWNTIRNSYNSHSVKTGQQTFTRYDPVSKIYRYVGKQDGSEWFGSGEYAPSNTCTLEHNYEIFRPNDISRGTYCEGTIMNAFYVDFGCADDLLIFRAPPAPPPPPVTSVAVYRLKAAGDFILSNILPDKTVAERNTWLSNNPIGTFLTVSRMQPILDTGLSDSTLEKFAFDAFGKNGKIYRITGVAHYYIEYVLPSMTAEDRNLFKTKYPVGSFVADFEMDPIIALQDPYFPYYFETFSYVHRITQVGHDYIEYLLPTNTAEEREKFKTKYPVGTFVTDFDIDPIIARQDSYFPYYFDTFGTDKYSYRITGVAHYYIEYVLPSKTAAERNAFKIKYPVGSFIPHTTMEPIIERNDPYFPYYFETFGSFAPILIKNLETGAQVAPPSNSTL